MTLLVILAGILAVCSGVLKLFGRSRIPGSTPILPVVEALAGAGAPFYFLSQGFSLGPRLGAGSDPSSRVGAYLIFGLLGLVLVSSILQARKAGARRRKREETEGGRLATYIRYISVQQENRP